MQPTSLIIATLPAAEIKDGNVAEESEARTFVLPILSQSFAEMLRLLAIAGIDQPIHGTEETTNRFKTHGKTPRRASEGDVNSEFF